LLFFQVINHALLRTQSWFILGHIFGILAVLWSTILVSHAVSNRNIKEFWTGMGQCIWLIANLWWMSSELHDNEYPNADKLYPQRTIESGYVMIAAIVWLMVYYVVIYPLSLCQPSYSARALYNDTNLTCRFPSLFSSWRDYENSQ